MFESGLFDFHKLVATVLKSTFPKSLSKIITYRSHKNFSNDLLQDNFKNYWNQNKKWLLNLLVSQDLQKYS